MKINNRFFLSFQHECFVCKKQFKKLRDVENHLARKTPCDVKENYKNQCAKCGKKFKTKRILRGHVKSACSVNSNAFQCTICTATYKYKQSLNKHYAITHNEK